MLKCHISAKSCHYVKPRVIISKIDIPVTLYHIATLSFYCSVMWFTLSPMSCCKCFPMSYIYWGLLDVVYSYYFSLVA